MATITKLKLVMTIMATLTLGASTALAQHERGSEPKHDEKAPAHEKVVERTGDPYSFDTCPITGKKLGSTADSVVKMYDGREVRFCCPACPEKFEKDLAANLAKLDEKIIKDQGPLYPLKTSVVTGKDLPAKPYDFVYGNRLVRLGAEAEKADFLKDGKKYLGEIDKVTIAEQGKNYSLTKCPVSGEAFGGDMGKPVDTVVAGRFIRLCCKSCKKDIEKDPAKYIALVDASRKGGKEKPDHDRKDHDDKKP